MEKIKMFTTFTGIGSFEMAMKNIGLKFDVMGVSEVDKHAIIAYEAIHLDEDKNFIYPSKDEMIKEFISKNIAYNFSTNKSEMPRSIIDIKKLYKAHKRIKNYGDIRKINTLGLPEFNFFTYSFPCKNISVAGGQAGGEEGSGTQSSLLWECQKIIELKRPKYLMMENVKNLVGKNHKPLLDMWISLLDSLGYKSYYKVLNAKDFGVPQNRERVMMVSILKPIKKDYIFPDSIELKKTLHELLEENIPENLFIDPKKYNHIINNLDIKKINLSKNSLYCVGNVEKKEHANSRIYYEGGLCPTLNSMNGGNRQPKIMMGCAIRGRNPDNPKLRISGIEKIQMCEINKNPQISNCLSTVSKDTLMFDLTEYKVRRLTALECWRIMGFSDIDYNKTLKAGLPISKLYERAGRGIAVPMLEQLFINLFNIERKKCRRGKWIKKL